MSPFAALLGRRALAVLAPVLISTVIPFVLQDKPVLQWVAGRTVPMIVDRVDRKLDEAEVGGQPTAEVVYACPIHPDVSQNEPGFCRKCGMALKPTTDTAQTKPISEKSEIALRVPGIKLDILPKTPRPPVQPPSG